MSKDVIGSFQGEYRWLSNFWPAEVEMGGDVYKTVEHAYQAAKFKPGDPHRETIRLASTPGVAKRLGRYGQNARKDWDSVKVPIMRKLVKQKFEKHADLRQKLLDTGDARLEEGNTWNDKFWGVCNGIGRNMLGRILMDVRRELKTTKE